MREIVCGIPLEEARADVLVELSTLNPESGEPAVSHIRAAFGLGMHVVTANKGPVAYAYAELSAEAQRRGVRLLHESTVMDGAPVFNLVRHNLPGVGVFGFTGVLNSTTNLVIKAMENGASFDEGIARAKVLGVAEENHEHDTQGWDSADGEKQRALANVLMDARVTPADVDREGIHGFTPERIRELTGEGKTIRLVSRAERIGDRIRLGVRPGVSGENGVARRGCRHFQSHPVSYRPYGNAGHGLDLARRRANPPTAFISICWNWSAKLTQNAIDDVSLLPGEHEQERDHAGNVLDSGRYRARD